jgi:ATP phosphoribosyltransferase
MCFVGAQFDNVEIWFQRATDVVRKLVEGNMDLGIVGYDLFAEVAGEVADDLIVVHDSLNFGHCRLSVAVPTQWSDISSLGDLRQASWSENRPLRVVTGYLSLAKRFFEQSGFEHVKLTTADGALEAAPAMGTADCILDLVSSGTTLRENSLKELEGGTVTESEGVLIASKRALLKRDGCLEVVREMIERFDAHLRAEGQYLITANTRGSSPEEVANKLNDVGGELLVGLEGPTISPIYSPAKKGSGGLQGGQYYAVNIVVPRKDIYRAVRLLRRADGSGVCVAPITYIYDEVPAQWSKLCDKLGIEAGNSNESNAA